MLLGINPYNQKVHASPEVNMEGLGATHNPEDSVNKFLDARRSQGHL